MMRTWRKLRALSTGEILMLLEAGLALVLAWITVRLLPSRALPPLNGHADIPRFPAREQEPDVPTRVAWSIRVMASRVPGNMTCLIQALAAQAMLRRRGLQPQMRIGVAGRDASGTITAHAWVECDGKVVVGDVDDLAAYALLSHPPVP